MQLYLQKIIYFLFYLDNFYIEYIYYIRSFCFSRLKIKGTDWVQHIYCCFVQQFTPIVILYRLLSTTWKLTSRRAYKIQKLEVIILAVFLFCSLLLLATWKSRLCSARFVNWWNYLMQKNSFLHSSSSFPSLLLWALLPREDPLDLGVAPLVLAHLRLG